MFKANFGGALPPVTTGLFLYETKLRRKISICVNKICTNFKSCW